MSQKTVEQIIGRLVTDARFREMAARDFETVCIKEGYDLSEDERKIMAALDFKKLEWADKHWLDAQIKRFARNKREKGG